MTAAEVERLEAILRENERQKMALEAIALAVLSADDCKRIAAKALDAFGGP